jgi:hypothetical protein
MEGAEDFMSASTLTLFTTMKPFRGEIARIQQNAIKSWLALRPRPAVMVFGEEAGVPEACCQFDLTLVSDVERAPSGLPYLDDLFAKAQRLARTQTLCYVNADILLTGDLSRALDAVHRRFGKAMMVCGPHNVAVPYEIETSDSAWEQIVRARVAAETSRPTRCADVFIFPKGFYCRLPRLEMGRYYFDNVLLWQACFGDLPAVDLTDGVLTVHQRHDQSSHPGTSASDAEQLVGFGYSEWNRQRTRWWERHCSRLELPFVLTADGSVTQRSMMPRAAALGAITIRQCSSLKFHVLYKTLRLRRKLRLYRWWQQDAPSRHLQGQPRC